MTVEYQIVPISLGKGIESKGDSKQIVPGKLVLLENATLRKPGKIQKANRVASLSAIRAAIEQNISLTLDNPIIRSANEVNNINASGNRIYGAIKVNNPTSVNENASFQYLAKLTRAPAESWEVYGMSKGIFDVKAMRLQSVGHGQARSSSIVELTDGRLVVGYVQATATGAGGTRYDARFQIISADMESTFTLDSFADVAQIRMVTDGTDVVIAMHDITTDTLNLYYLEVPQALGDARPLLTSVTSINVATTDAPLSWDLIAKTVGGFLKVFICYQNRNAGADRLNVEKRTFSSALTSEATYTYTVAAVATVRRSVMCWDSVNEKLTVHYTLDATLATVRGFRLTSALAFDVNYVNIVLAFNSVHIFTAFSGLSNRIFVLASSYSATLYGGLRSQNDWYTEIYSCDTGANTLVRVLDNVTIIGRPYGPTGDSGSTNLVDGLVPCIFGQSDAGTVSPYFCIKSLESHSLGFYSPPLISSQHAGAQAARAYVGELDTANTYYVGSYTFNKKNHYAVPLKSGAVGILRLHIDSEKSLSLDNVSDTTIIGSGHIAQDAGSSIEELGFSSFPVVTQLSQSAGGSLTALNAYGYKAVYRFIDSNGDVVYSAPSAAKSITLTAGNQTVTAIVPMYIGEFNRRTTKVVVELYRTAGNGSVYYLAQSIVQEYDGATITWARPFVATFTDTLSDATLASNQVLYTEGGILENIQPEVVRCVGSFKGRAIVACPTRRELWYSKAKQAGRGIEFSDVFVIPYPNRKYGDVSAIIGLADVCIIGCEKGLLYISGEGPNDTGLSGIFRDPAEITANVGIVHPRAFCKIPLGILFKSRKGFYLLDKNLQVTYIGSPVEYWNDRNCSSITADDDNNEVHCYHTDGPCLVYNYDTGEWGTLPGREANGACIVDGLIYFTNTSKVLQKVVEGEYDTSTIKLRTGWLSLNQIVGLQRVRRLYILGRYKSAHTLRVKLSYDYNPKVVDTIDIDPDASGIDIGAFTDATIYENTAYTKGDIYIYRVHMPRQKCIAVQIQIEDVSPTGTNESMELSALAFEIGAKTGGAKLKAEASY